MKNLLGIFLLLQIMCLFLSCSSREEKLSGSWKVVDFEYEFDIPSDADITTNNIMFSRTYSFTTDGTVLINGEMLQNTKGTYRVSEDSLVISYQHFGKELSEHYELNKLTSDEMSLVSRINDYGVFQFQLIKKE